MRGDGLKAAVEVEVPHQQAFHPRIPVVRLHGRGQLGRAVLLQHFVGLDVDAPRVGARPHGAKGLRAEDGVAAAHVPLGLDDPDPRVGDGAHQVESLVLGLPDVHHHFVAHRQDGPDAGLHGEVQLDGIPDDGKP
jgi:hypothetical protein